MISISQEVRKVCNSIRLGWLKCPVRVHSADPKFKLLLKTECEQIMQKLSRDEISKLPQIAESRIAYRALGKDPARYRLSAEALLRRLLGGKDLYEINNVVDLLNLISIKSGFSIGGYDWDKIQFPVELGIGRNDEDYLAIGRGELNIENLPVLRDRAGAFGNPSSDSVRTRVNNQTSTFMMIFFDFNSNPDLNNILDETENLLIEFACQGEVERGIVQ